MGWEKFQLVILGLFLTGALSFSVWAATSINSLTTGAAVNQRESEQIRRTLDLQQSQISAFSKVLSEINADVKVIKALMEDRDKRGGM